VHLIDGRVILSSSDLTGFLECPHLTQQELAATRGEIRRPQRHDPELELLTRLGTEHEERHLAGYRESGRTVRAMTAPKTSVQAYKRAQEETLEAMRAGIDTIYQATLFDGRWLGYADFLEKVDRPSDLGLYSYEVVDTKLARSAKAAALLQTCLYSEFLARLQGGDPEWMHLILGDDSRLRYRVADYRAYLRHAKGRLESVAGAGPMATYPEPVEHCGICRWQEICDARWREDDNLVLVAGLNRAQARKLTVSGVTTVAALASTVDDLSPTGISTSAIERLRRQAKLQVLERETGIPAYELLRSERPELGLGALPPPTHGDLFFDMESDPWALDGGLEYLFGIIEIEAGEPRFWPFWAHSREGEKRAFEAFIDFAMERLRRCPDLHVYHYSGYEPTALKRLMGRHGTREAEVDSLLRGQIMVDLYRVVRQSLLASRESYGLKALEDFYMPARSDTIADAGGSIVAYERWRETGDQQLLDEIARYNEQDCTSTWRLRGWLEDRRSEAEKKFGAAIPRPQLLEPEPGEALKAWEQEIEDLANRLTGGAALSAVGSDHGHAARWLLGEQLFWHRREQKSDWWGYYERLQMTDEELRDDSEALGGLTYEGEVGNIKRSILHRYRFPPQDHKLGVGQAPIDPRTKRPAGEVHAIDNIEGWIDLRRGAGSAVPDPAALIPPTPIEDRVLRDGIRRVAESVAATGIDGRGSYKAIRELLLLSRPSIQGAEPRGGLAENGEPATEAARRLVSRLSDSYLAIQGPPGTGKTRLGAKMIVDLIEAGQRVGITATSHKVISHLLDGVCEESKRRGHRLRALQKAEDDQRCDSPEVKSTQSNADIDDALAGAEVELVAGTAWLFARDELEGKLDVLFVDEAGQMSLANVIGASTSSASLVLLGDPNQLAQPSKGSHPDGADLSVLDHVLDGSQTISDERGLFLAISWRMHPDVCGFISEVAYENRLESAPECSRQLVGGDGPLSGTGLRYVPVEHSGNRTSSAEEAGAVAAAYGALVGRTWTDRESKQRSLTADDILVVAPYNAQVAQLATRLPRGARVGTVDKFQGQEAPVVMYSLATSSAAEAPRGMDFLYSLHRLNVAISRAQGLAILVCSPALLEVKAHTPKQMRLANALCRLVEVAAAAHISAGQALRNPP